MANNLGSLVVSLGLDAAEFTRGLTKAEYQQQQWARRVETSIEGARTGALAAFAAMGTAAAVLNQQIEGIAGFQGLAEKIGDTATAVASLKTASDVSGVSLETFASASVKLTSALSKIDDDSKGAGLALKAIGLNMESFKALSPVEQFESVAKALAGFEDGAGKTAVAVQLFGKSGADLIPMLNDLASGSERQTRLTADQIAAADAYTKQTAHLRSELQTLVQVTAADAVPTMSAMVGMLQDVVRYSSDAGGSFSVMGALMGGAKTALQTVIVLGSDVAFVFKQVGNEIGGMAAQIAALATLDFAGFNAISKAMKEDAARARAELDKFQAGVMAGPAAPGQSINDRAAARALRNGSPVPGGAARSLEFNFTPSRAGSAGRAAGKTDAQREAERAEADYQQRLKDYANDQDAYVQARHNKRLSEQEKEEKRYLDDLAQYAADQDAYVQARHAKRIKEQEDAEKEAADRIKKVQEYQAKSLADAYSNTFNRMFTEGMKFGDLLKKLAFDAINIQLLTPATQKIGSSIGSAVSSIFSGFSYDGGGYTGGGSRSGGLDGKGGFMALLHPNETVLDHTRGQGAGGGTVIQQTISIDARGAGDGVEQRIRAAMAQTKAETLAAVQAKANRGGSFSSALGRA